MKVLILGLLSFLVIITAAEYKFSQTAKDCVAEIKTDEETIRPLLPEDAPFPEDNKLVLNFFECIFRSNINDNNELIVDDKLKNYFNHIISTRIQGKKKLAALVGNDCVEHCKNQKGGSKGETAVKVMNCVKGRFFEYFNEKD